MCGDSSSQAPKNDKEKRNDGEITIVFHVKHRQFLIVSSVY